MLSRNSLFRFGNYVCSYVATNSAKNANSAQVKVQQLHLRGSRCRYHFQMSYIFRLYKELTSLKDTCNLIIIRRKCLLITLDRKKQVVVVENVLAAMLDKIKKDVG